MFWMLADCQCVWGRAEADVKTFPKMWLRLRTQRPRLDLNLQTDWSSSGKKAKAKHSLLLCYYIVIIIIIIAWLRLWVTASVFGKVNWLIFIRQKAKAKHSLYYILLYCYYCLTEALHYSQLIRKSELFPLATNTLFYFWPTRSLSCPGADSDRTSCKTCSVSEKAIQKSLSIDTSQIWHEVASL